jgi:predicted RNA-binding Zn-ribbon protein involved in translation (DUF1610 family)
VTDHLEPYRRMVRSIRFVPPLARNQQYEQQGQLPLTPESPVNSSPSKIAVTPAPGPAIDPSEHVADLVRTAVSKPAVIPVTYTIPENIGDRISRLAPPKTVTPVIIPPKIPQPDPNWKPADTVVAQYIELDWHDLLEKSPTDASAQVEVATEPTQVEETPQEVPAPEASTTVAAPTQVEEIPQEVPAPEASTTVAASAQVEETPQEVPAPEASTTVAAPAQVEETPQEVPAPEASTTVAAPTQVEETPQEVPAPEASTTVAAPAQVEETPQEVPAPEASTTVAAPAQVEETPQEVPSASENATVNLKDAVTSLESVETDDRKTSDKEQEIQIQCPTCESTEIRKNGHRKDKQRYVCKDCGKQFVLPDALVDKNDRLNTKTSSPAKTSEVKEPQSLTGVSDSSSKSSQAPSKDKKKAKGFGTRKAKK